MDLCKCLEWKVDLCVKSFGAGFCEHSCNQCIIFKNCLCRGMVGEKGGGGAVMLCVLCEHLVYKHVGCFETG